MRNCLSLVELIALISEEHGRAPAVDFGHWRRGDQRYYVSDTAAFTAATGWRPRTPPRDGVRRLHRWPFTRTDGERNAAAAAA